MAAQRSIEMDGHRIELTNLDKMFFPADGLTKGDLIDYYARIAPTALPHYRDRMLSMERFPNGIETRGFFQKDVPDHFPEWLECARLEKQDGTLCYAIVNDAASLVYLANQGTVTPHLALSRRDAPHHPDRLVFDLDPSDGDFTKVQAAAELVRARLEALGLETFVQTTGSRGLHIVVPLDRKRDFEACRAFSRAVAEELATRHPTLLTVAMRKRERGAKVFVDYLRNAYGQTAVAPYAVRARPGAPVATPLTWDEVGARRLSAQKYTIRNLFRRLGQRSDPWERIGACPQSLDGAIEALVGQAKPDRSRADDRSRANDRARRAVGDRGAA